MATGGNEVFWTYVCAKLSDYLDNPEIKFSDFEEAFHGAWSKDRGDGERRPDYNKTAWMYVQGKLATYKNIQLN